jgi:hypothetical protein
VDGGGKIMPGTANERNTLPAKMGRPSDEHFGEMCTKIIRNLQNKFWQTSKHRHISLFSRDDKVESRKMLVHEFHK